jgi:polyisoprenoid-binding protein YceI
MKMHLLFLLIASWVAGVGIPVQKTYSLSGNYAVRIHGTFSIHDWSETIGKVSGELVGTANGDGSALVQSIRIVMQVRSIKGDMGSVMNNRTYKALKGDADPEVTFLLTGPVELNRIGAGSKAVSVRGTLTLAGVTRAVVMSVISFTSAHGIMAVEGEQNISMTDFGIRPPSALFGTMVASPEITIYFKTDFTIQQK